MPATKLPASVYAHPELYDIAYRWDTKTECDLLEACLADFGVGRKPVSILDIGCGSGRHLLELARRGHRTTGFDLYPEMVAFVNERIKASEGDEPLRVEVSVGDLRAMTLRGRYELAVCLMDTFRFLLTNDEIIQHLQLVAEHLTPGGLYVTDFWIPMQWNKAANEIYQWEQTEGETVVKAFYVQHPDTMDPVQQTFEDELAFVVEGQGEPREIRGARTRTRLILPQEFRALVAASGVFDVVGSYGEFDVTKPLEPDSGTWRMISVLKRR